MRSCSSAISAFGVVVKMVKLQVTVSSGQRKLPQPGERHRLPVLTGDRVGLLAALNQTPLIERVGRHVLRRTIREEKAARILV